MKIRGIIKEADYVAAQFLAFLQSGLIFILLGLIILAAFILRSIVMFGVAVFSFAWIAIVIPWRAKQIYKQYKELSESVTIEIREDGLYFKRLNGEDLMPWSHIVKWHRSKRLLLLYPASNIFYIIPSHFFTSEQEFVAFVEIVKSRVSLAK